MEELEELKTKLKEKQKDLEKIKKNDVFRIVEEINNRTIYHTKIFSDFFKFGINKRNNKKFFLFLRGFFDLKKMMSFNLFALKEGDLFLGIFYGYNKKFKSMNIKIGDNPSITINTHNYIEFRFKNGSIFCYLKSLHFLRKKENENKNYYKLLLENFLKLEKEVYEFYEKEYKQEKGILKWIEKRQK